MEARCPTMLPPSSLGPRKTGFRLISANASCWDFRNQIYLVLHWVTTSCLWHPQSEGLNLYKSLVFPIFSYSSAAWYASKCDMVIIDRVQCRCNKWILGSQDLSYVNRLTRLNILPVSLHLQIADVLLLSSIMSGKYDFNWHEFVKLHIHRTTSSSDRLLFEIPLSVLRSSEITFGIACHG